MKTIFPPSSRRRQNQKGSAVLIVIILLGAMLVFIASNTRNLNQLKREIDLIEQKQLQRQGASVTQPAASPPNSNPNSAVEMGSTGDSPVPSGHWPDGTPGTSFLETNASRDWRAVPVPSGESPLGTGQWPVLPAVVAAALEESRFNQP